MINWITANIGTIVVALIVAGILAAIIVSIVKDKKAGISTCGCGFENCAMKGKCHGEKCVFREVKGNRNGQFK